MYQELKLNIVEEEAPVYGTYKDRVFRMLLKEKRRLLELYIVFYNGTERKEEEFLREQKAEVMAMSIYEYNEEYVKKSLYEDGVEDGFAQGEAVGMLKSLVKNVEAIMKNLHLSLQEACEGLGTTVEEYEKAKAVK